MTNIEQDFNALVTLVDELTLVVQAHLDNTSSMTDEEARRLRVLTTTVDNVHIKLRRLYREERTSP